MKVDRCWVNARIATMTGDALGTIDDGVVATLGGRIAFAGPRASAAPIVADETIDCTGRWITPGLIDCHTHLIYAGNRSDEFEQRLAGASYEAIARAGGGILSTVRATRATSEHDLVAQSQARLAALAADGVTTVEIKSGYGLDTQAECRMLRAARALGTECDVRAVTTFLGLHAVPPEFSGDADGYVDHVIAEMLPAVAREGLADAVDAFCEGIGFTPAQVARVFESARALGLPVKLHAEQLSDLGGAAMAASFGALSADHLEYLDNGGIAAMRNAGSVAVLLPGAFYFTRETRLPPVAALQAAGVPIAVATDCNPGTSPLTSLLLVANMAATLFRLDVESCLKGITSVAARALGLADQIGTITVGKQCDLAIWDIDRPADLVYRIGSSPLWQRVVGGRITGPTA